MTRTFNVTFAAAFLVASVFGGTAAFAGDRDYYRGASRGTAQSRNIDRYTTHGIRDDRRAHSAGNWRKGPFTGDYYEGANRYDD